VRRVDGSIHSELKSKTTWRRENIVPTKQKNLRGGCPSPGQLKIKRRDSVMCPREKKSYSEDGWGGGKNTSRSQTKYLYKSPEKVNVGSLTTRG